MKAERRHELQENSLVRGIRNFPEIWRAYGSKIMLGVILVLLAIVLVRMWANNKAEARRKLSEDLTTARFAFETFRTARETAEQQRNPMGMPPPAMPAETVSKRRTEIWSKVEAAVSGVLKESSEPEQQAEAKLLRADLNFHFGLLAKLGQMPEALTRPALKLENTSQEYMNRAEQNYNDLLNQQTKLTELQAAAVQFGLAAIAENNKDYAKARQHYEKVRDNAQDEVFKRQAARGLERLAAYRTDLLLGPARTPPTFKPPMTAPSATTTTATQATTGPSTVPTTPATEPTSPPATGPATSPATSTGSSPGTTPATQP